LPEEFTKFPNFTNDANKLQKALDLIAEWADEWQLQLSVNKCNILNVGYAPSVTDYYVYILFSQHA